MHSVLFYPDFPIFKSVLNRYLRGTGFNITNNPRVPFDLAVAWQDATFRPVYPFLESLRDRCRVINIDCSDISKQRVEAASQAVFGYGLAVDPARYHGLCVRKDNHNGRHDRTAILECPLSEPEPDCVYQRLVDNRTLDDWVWDLRLQVCGDRMPLATRRYRPESRRFIGDVHEVIRDPSAWLSARERERVLALAHAMGLDFGEIDAVRDRTDGYLYVVDVNDTPIQIDPTDSFPRADWRRYLRWGRAAFHEQFLAPAVHGRTSAGQRPPDDGV